MADSARTRRAPLTRERVLRAAVQLADEQGVEALTMRNLGRAVGVEAMSLYNHVANKEDVLDGLVEALMGEILTAVEGIEPPAEPAEWQQVVRRRILAAREVMLRHPWAPEVLESRTEIPPSVLPYYDSLLRLLREAGFSIDVAHHAVHALGTRALGFTRELFVTGNGSGELDPAMEAALMQQIAGRFPHLGELIRAVSHDPGSTVGSPCDDQFEFEFGLDLILDGLERLREGAVTEA